MDAFQGGGTGRTPLVLIGAAKFNPSQRGNRASAPSAIARFLATKFPVFYIDEFRSSINCPKCFNAMHVVRGTRERHWTCSNESCRSTGMTVNFLVNKDKSAAVNMFICMVSMLMCGERPIRFRRPKKDDDDDCGGGNSGGGGDSGGGGNSGGGGDSGGGDGTGDSGRSRKRTESCRFQKLSDLTNGHWYTTSNK